MLNRARIFTLVLACLVVFGTLFQTYRFEERVNADNASEDTAIRQLHATALALADARQAQSSYVAAGQGAEFWMSHFDEALSRVEGTLRERQQSTKAAGALTHYDAAIEELEALRTSDRRARNYVNNGQLILASDVIFVESQEIFGRIAANVSAASDTEGFAARQSVATVTRYRQGLMAGGLLVTLLLLIVVPRKTRTEEPAEGPVSLNVTPEPAPRPVEAMPALDDAADVCVDIARLLDGRDLPAILSRAATAIDAKGLVLWVMDEHGQTLRASMGHGYSDRMLTRLGHLPVSADNATSLASRTLQPQMVPGAVPGSSGALAVPLISTTGCVGVLSAEVSGARANGHQVSVARLIAAQLSAVIRPDAAAMPSSVAQ
jgi:hypothetical protein